MRVSRLAATTLLLAAVARAGASLAWAVSRNDNGPGMHNGAAWMRGYAPGGAQHPVSSLADARASATAYANRLNLRVDEVLQFKRNYYVKLVDRNGDGAAEVLVDPKTGVVSLEYGPAMMWNTKYGMASGRWSHMPGRAMMGRYGNTMMNGNGGGMMGGNGPGGMMNGNGPGGMMGGGATTTDAGSRVSMSDARNLAQRWLDADDPGVTVETGGDAFPGYFTFETLRDGRVEGMISVRESTGAVWRHWWHGAFVAQA